MPASRPDPEITPAPLPRTGCVIVTYGAPSAAAALLAILQEAGVHSDMIVVVDNPASARPHPPVRTPQLIELPVNVGYGAAMAVGVTALAPHRPDFYLLATPDLSCSVSAIRALITAAAGATGHGVLGPVLHDPVTHRVMSHGGRISARGGASHHYLAPGPAAAAVHDVDWVDGALMMVRRVAWEAVGGVDGSFFMYYEDVDLCLRVRRAGWRIGIAAAVRVEQSPGFTRRPLAFGYLNARNDLAVRRRHAGPGAVASGLAGNLIRASRYSTKSRGWLVTDRLAYQAAVVAGLVDFARGRHGPPPRWCCDDIAATHRSHQSADPTR